MVKKNNFYLPVLLSVLIAIYTIIILSPALKCDFLVYDDDLFITQNPLVVNKDINVKQIFTSVAAKNDYYPITILTLAWNYQQGKLDPAGYHFWNLMLHALNTILVFFVTYLLTKRNLLMAAIVSMLFGIHPMHVESVAWATERKDVLFLFFFMGGLITYLYYINSKKWLWYFITILLFVLSCLSKGTAVVFPFVLLLIDYLILSKVSIKNMYDKIVFIIISFLFMLFTYRLHQTGTLNNLADNRSFIFRILTATYQLMMYAVKLVIPYPLSIFYQNADEKNLPLIYYLSPLIIAVIAVGLYYLRKEKELIFGVFFYLVSIALMLQIIPTGGGLFIMSDRFTYLAYIGLFFIIAYWMNKAVNSTKNKLFGIIAKSILVTGILIFSFQSYSRAKVWTNSETLFSDAIEKDSTNSYSYLMRGVYRFKKNNFVEAMNDLNKSIYFDSLFEQAYYDRAMIHDKSGNIDAAIKDYKKAINIKPFRVEAFDNLGWDYFLKSNTDSAIVYYNKAIKLNPEYANVYNNLGVVYSSLGNAREALINYNKALQLLPDFTNARINRAKTKVEMNDFLGAMEDWNFLTKTLANEPKLYYSRAMTYLKMKDTANACKDFKIASDLGSMEAKSASSTICKY